MGGNAKVMRKMSPPLPPNPVHSVAVHITSVKKETNTSLDQMVRKIHFVNNIFRITWNASSGKKIQTAMNDNITQDLELVRNLMGFFLNYY